MKVYFKGFIKGLGLFLVCLIFSVFLAIIGVDSGILDLLVPITGSFLAMFLVYKFKLARYWYLFALLVGFLAFPFLFGARETLLKPKK